MKPIRHKITYKVHTKCYNYICMYKKTEGDVCHILVVLILEIGVADDISSFLIVFWIV